MVFLTMRGKSEMTIKMTIYDRLKSPLKIYSNTLKCFPRLGTLISIFSWEIHIVKKMEPTIASEGFFCVSDTNNEEWWWEKV